MGGTPRISRQSTRPCTCATQRTRGRRVSRNLLCFRCQVGRGARGRLAPPPFFFFFLSFFLLESVGGLHGRAGGRASWGLITCACNMLRTLPLALPPCPCSAYYPTAVAQTGERKEEKGGGGSAGPIADAADLHAYVYACVRACVRCMRVKCSSLVACCTAHVCMYVCMWELGMGQPEGMGSLRRAEVLLLCLSMGRGRV